MTLNTNKFNYPMNWDQCSHYNVIDNSTIQESTREFHENNLNKILGYIDDINKEIEKKRLIVESLSRTAREESESIIQSLVFQVVEQEKQFLDDYTKNGLSGVCVQWFVKKFISIFLDPANPLDNKYTVVDIKDRPLEDGIGFILRYNNNLDNTLEVIIPSCCHKPLSSASYNNISSQLLTPNSSYYPVDYKDYYDYRYEGFCYSSGDKPERNIIVVHRPFTHGSSKVEIKTYKISKVKEILKDFAERCKKQKTHKKK